MSPPNDQNTPRYGVVFMAATRAEIKPVCALIADLTRTNQLPCAMTGEVSGIGADRAVRKFHDLIDRYAPQCFVLVGFSGGLDPSLKAGHAYWPTWVLNESGDSYFLGPIAPQPGFPQAGTPVHKVHLTVDHVVGSPAAKCALRTRFSAGAVDMESFAVAGAAARREVKLVIVRSVFDPADAALPPGCERWVRSDGTVDRRVAVKYVLARPWSVPALLRMSRQAHLAAIGLARAVQQVVLDPLAAARRPRG